MNCYEIIPPPAGYSVTTTVTYETYKPGVIAHTIEITTTPADEEPLYLWRVIAHRPGYQNGVVMQYAPAHTLADAVIAAEAAYQSVILWTPTTAPNIKGKWRQIEGYRTIVLAVRETPHMYDQPATWSWFLAYHNGPPQRQGIEKTEQEATAAAEAAARPYLYDWDTPTPAAHPPI